MTAKKTFNLPPRIAGGAPIELEQGSRVVLVGANGSGKTRFGIWLEANNQNQMTVHRISAQKALTLPDFAPMKNLEQAEKDLLLGRSDQHASIDRKLHDRWGGSPATFLLSDYEKVLALLFAKDGDRDRLHTAETRASGQYVPVKDSPIDTIVKVWGDLMPHRAIAFYDGRVLVGKGTAAEYHAREMSDGERVALYLLGQCLCAPDGCMLIVDEPELHLHKSLMDKLWNKVEELCPGKTIVYITHDLDFAAGRAGAQKIWIQSFSGKDWVWGDIPTDEALPETLILEIIGNRKRLLFCEGERGGLDQTIYQLCFPSVHVIPREGSDKVIESTKALRSNGQLHSFAAKGIVDRDVRGDHEIASLAAHGIEVLGFAEVENLLCTEEMVALVAGQLSLNGADTVTVVRDYVSAALNSELEAQIVMRAERVVRNHLSQYTVSSSDELGLQQGVSDLLTALKISSIVADSRKVFSDTLASGRLNEMLKVYNRKSLADRISTCFGMKHGEYPALLLRLIKGPDREVYVKALVSLLPTLGSA